jgi:hypothetical protein
MTKEMLDKLIEQERRETFDSINPGYHNELLKALVELKNIQESCEDCISREAVLAMSDYIGETPTYDDPLGEVEEVVRVKDIMALPSVTPAQRWIPVSERLPEKSMRCLVVVGRFNFIEIATYSDLMGIIDHKIFYQGVVGHDDFVNITSFVKAWMPLPERYTEREAADGN